MRIELQPDALEAIPETEVETAELAAWRAAHADVVFTLVSTAGQFRLASLGLCMQACREPINVHSAHPDPRISIIANFAATPFTLDGVHYACVEAFWQSLRFAPGERARIAMLDGASAKRASAGRPYGSHVEYQGSAVAVGTHAHWQLMRRACTAKFEQNEPARAALLATGDRPLVHRVVPDSVTIPGVIMADIWMTLRHRLRASARA